ncbi:MAG: hypothetical protein U0175_00415 [Caldilineaceae bacterium]
MIRTMPKAHNEEIELYIRTYYSLLRSSEPIRVRSLEETHTAINSNLHQFAMAPDVDISALLYSALRLPDCIAQTKLLVMGQMADVFRREGYPDVEQWQPVKARARRRKFYFDDSSKTLAALIASVSDIDDVIPCLVTFQIEWNKLHTKLLNGSLRERLLMVNLEEDILDQSLFKEVRKVLELTAEDFEKLEQVWSGKQLLGKLQLAASQRMDTRIKVLGSGLSDYRRSVQAWWNRVNESCKELQLTERPIYFVSSNTHSIINLLSGFADQHREEILKFVRRDKPEDLWIELPKLSDNEGALRNLIYYASRLYASRYRLQEQALKAEQEVGIMRVSEPHGLEVEAQVIEINKLDPARFDPRLATSEYDWSVLRNSNALIFNIDYPLGMAAYHIFSQISTAGGRILGLYILGKAATLNARVGDVMIPNVVYDEHSQNSYLFRNCFTAQDVSPYLLYGTVFDNQKSVTVRGTILQNAQFMHVFYEEGYTDIEMEAGPYLSAIYEDVYPRRHPTDEIVNLFINAPYDIGIVHYASDTPISRRQMLLSKSLSYFGVDATYATSLTVLRRILQMEVRRQQKTRE